MTENDLDLLLINPGGRKRSYQSLGRTLAAIEPPIWAGLIASFIRRLGLSVSIIDANAENIGIKETVSRAANINPLLTAILVYGHNPSASTQVMPTAGAICKELNLIDPNIKTILVGGHVAALPERTIKEESSTFVAGGEGPYTIYDLIRVLRNNSSDYRSVRGLWYRDNKEIKSNSPAPLVNLDIEMPYIAWDLLPMNKYQAHNWHCFGDIPRKPYAAIYTSLGCPFHCDFCCIQAPFRDGEKVLGYKSSMSSYRLWNSRTIISQIDFLVNEYNIQNIKFADEIFVFNKKHVEKICDLIISKGYDLNIWSYARVDNLDKEILRKMKKAGINWLGVGIESANSNIRKGINKGYDQHHIFKAINVMRNEGINIGANYIFGLPNDNMQSMRETLDLALKINSEWANFYCTMAYPGSKLYERATKEGWKLPNTWNGYSQYAIDTLPLPTKYLSAIDILKFRDYAFQAYFSSPKYLEMIRQKFGDNTVDHIQDMARHSLERELIKENNKHI